MIRGNVRVAVYVLPENEIDNSNCIASNESSFFGFTSDDDVVEKNDDEIFFEDVFEAKRRTGSMRASFTAIPKPLFFRSCLVDVSFP
mmetsp:Transcript_12167/g.17333  ORF Transcript_12167/g.17333 Transcript_12167/m.17333 type:complete len:87 (+) Transcript_12167:756-1016(+)